VLKSKYLNTLNFRAAHQWPNFAHLDAQNSTTARLHHETKLEFMSIISRFGVNKIRAKIIKKNGVL